METNEPLGIRVRRNPGDEHDPVPQSKLARADWLKRNRRERDQGAGNESHDSSDSPARDDESSPGAHAQLF